MLRSRFGLFVVFLVVLLGVFLGKNVVGAKLSDEELMEYSLNDIMFYGPCATDSSDSSTLSGEITISGSTAEEKLWSGLKSFLSDEQAAGIMGNIGQEDGNYNPVRREVGQSGGLYNRNVQMGLGFVQWSFGRRVNLLDYIKERDGSLLKYFEDESLAQISGDDFIERVGENDANKIFQLEVEFIKNEIDRSYQKYYDIKDIDEATVWFRENYERAGVYSDSFRKQKAHEAYDKFTKKTSPVSYTQSSTSGGGGSSSSSSESVSGNAKKISDTAIRLAWPKSASGSDYKENQGGKPTDAMLDAWEKLGTKDRNLSHGADCGWFVQTVVAASGVDPEYTEATKGDAAGLNSFEEWVKKNPNKWEEINFGNGSDTSKLRAGDVIMSWVGSRANPSGFHGWVIAELDGELYVVEAGYSAGHNGFWGHVSEKVENYTVPTDELVIFRAKGGPSCDSCEKGSMNINGAAVCLAWPLGTDPGKTLWPSGTGTELFNDFWAKEEGVVKGDGTGDCWDKGAYCCGFSAAAVRYSGYDPDFQSACDVGDNLGGGANQYLYVKEHSDLWELIPWNGDKAKLKGGDVIYYSGSGMGHSYVIVQDEKGEVYIAEASMCDFYGRITEYRAPPLGTSAYIFRAKNAKNSTAGVSVTDGVKTSSRTGKLTGGTGQNNGDINTTAFELAWPEGTPASTYRSKAWDKFVEAFNSLPGRKNTGGQSWKDGKSCMVFVNTVLNYAGALDMDKLSSVTWDLIKSDEWEEVGGEGNDGKGLKYKDLEPGDVLAYFASGPASDGSAQYKGLGLHHEALYGENSNGEGRIIESSFESEWGHVSGRDINPNSTIAGGWAQMVRVFRWKKNSSGDECDVCAGSEEGGGELKAGGFDTVEEATKFMQSYIDAASPGGQYWMKFTDAKFGVKSGQIHNAGCPYGVLNNCVAFSQWFVNNYTTVGPNWNNTTNGVDLVDALVKQGLKRGTEPRPYAIFSKSGPSSDGHTGVILGVNTSAKKVIVGDAACMSSGPFYKPRAYELSFDEVKNWWYAYTDDKVSMGGPLKNA